jgi:hypothetical protein
MSDKNEQDEKNPPQQISIQSDPQSAAGVYSNLMMVSHRKEEFVLDYLFVQPQNSPQGQGVANLRARIITSPEHIKRIAQALGENVRRYEEKFGEIEVATDLPKIMH